MYRLRGFHFWSVSTQHVLSVNILLFIALESYQCSVPADIKESTLITLKWYPLIFVLTLALSQRHKCKLEAGGQSVFSGKCSLFLFRSLFYLQTLFLVLLNSTNFLDVLTNVCKKGGHDRALRDISSRTALVETPKYVWCKSPQLCSFLLACIE